MKIKVEATLSTVPATLEDEIEIDESELEGLTDEEKEEYFFQVTREWAEERLNFTWEVIEEEGGEDD